MVNYTFIADPIGYDRAVFKSFYETYKKEFKTLFTILRDKKNWYDKRAYVLLPDSLDEGLVKKQTLHFFTAAAMTGGVKPEHIKAASYYVFLKTLPMQVLDTQIDYCLSYNIKQTLLSDKDIRTAWLFSNSSLYLGFQQLFADTTIPREVGTIISEVFRDVSQEMLYFFQVAYDKKRITNYTKELEFYRNSPISRLLGSGFFEATILSAFSINRMEITQEDRQIVKRMRRLRQLVDEIADFGEDLRAGELTLPYLYLLEDSRLRETATFLIGEVWNTAQDITKNAETQQDAMKRLTTDRKLSVMEKELKGLLMTSGALERVYKEADLLWLELVTLITIEWKKKRGFDTTEMITSLNLKRAFLERLKNQDWEDIPLEVL